MSDYHAELASLDATIAENDASEELCARLRAANALYEKAHLIDEREGAAAALDVFADVVRRVSGAPEDESRELLVCALNALAITHDELGQIAESRAVAETLVAEYFDDPPGESHDAVVSAAFLLATLLTDAGEYDAALPLLERLIWRYGQSDNPDHEFIAAAAESSAAWVLGCSGLVDEGIRRYDRVIHRLADESQIVPRRILARAMGKQAKLMYDASQDKVADARCRDIVSRFADDDDPEIGEQVAWARESIDYSKRTSRKRFSLWR